MSVNSLFHLVRQPKTRPSSRPPLLLLLHGIGSNEEDLFSLSDYFDPRFFIVSARAPLKLGPASYAWFNVEITPEKRKINVEQARSSRIKLLEFIDEVVEGYSVNPQQVYLLGFSQGAIMSFSIALTQPEKVAGIVAISGRVVTETLPRVARPAELADLPIFVAHGVNDQVLPIEHGRATCDYLSAFPVKLTYREYPMGHQVSPESLNDICAWLSARLVK